MNIVPLLLVFSLALVVAAVVLFVFSVRQGDCHEAERLCLMPLEDDTESRPIDSPTDPPDPNAPREKE
jgi:hypothetical protein